jgi:quercetin dioxygenase-like cupin family protein
MNISHSGSQPSRKGPADWFTGDVRIDAPFQATEPAKVGGATVTFEPGARTAWAYASAGPDADCGTRDAAGCRSGAKSRRR